jgi:hypothetical protein
MSSLLKTLSLQGQPLYYLETAAGLNLVLVRPICDLLGVDADRQIEKIKEDEILRDEHGVHRVHLPGDDRHRNWSCLPEEFIYGWLFAIQVTNTMKLETRATLTAYKRECYDILYQHFHGKIRQAQREVTRKATNAAEIVRLRERIEASAPKEFQRLRELEAENKRIGNPLQRLQNVQFQLEYDQALSSGE